MRTPGIPQPGVALHVDADFIHALRPLNGADPEEDGVARRRMMRASLLHPLTRGLLTEQQLFGGLAALFDSDADVCFSDTLISAHNISTSDTRVCMLTCCLTFSGGKQEVGVVPQRRSLWLLSLTAAHLSAG